MIWLESIELDHCYGSISINKISKCILRTKSRFRNNFKFEGRPRAHLC